MELRIKCALAARHPIDLNADHRDTIFVAGTGRSGTTWLANILNFRNEFRYIFEPFDAGRVELWIGLSSIQYLRPDEIDDRYLHAATAIVSGRYRSRWTDAFNRRIISRRRLVKAIRANLLLRWLHANFPGMPIILLLRHPCAVVNSWLHLDWPPSIEETFLEQPRLVEDYLHPYLGLIKGAKDVFSQLILQWCIESYVPLCQFRSGEMHVVFYELLCLEPERELRRLFSYLNREMDNRIAEAVRVPSNQTRKSSAILTGEDLANGWRKDVDQEQIRTAQEIPSQFGLDKIYSESSLPNSRQALDLLEK